MADYLFMTDNLLAGATIAVSSESEGVVGSAVKTGAGSAAGISGGVYTGAAQTNYTVQIDSVAAGKDIGQATFRWRRADSTAWEAAGLPTATSFTSLDNGVKIKWTAGPGDDFALNDAWRILCTKPFGRANLTDWDRNSLFSSAGLDGPTTLTADLGQAETATACVVYDHNLTGAATLTLLANDADAWASPAYSQALSLTSPAAVLFLDQTYRYWRLCLDDPANPEGAVRLSQWYLGRCQSPDLLVREGLERRLDAADPLLYPVEALKIEFFCPGQAARDDLLAIFTGQLEQTNRRMRPFFFCFEPDSPATTRLVAFGSTLDHRQVGPASHVVEVGLSEIERKYI